MPPQRHQAAPTPKSYMYLIDWDLVRGPAIFRQLAPWDYSATFSNSSHLRVLHYRPYPIKGRLVPDSKLKPLQDRVLTKEELAKHDGSAEEFPEGYATAPIYLGAGDKVYDVSFGGVGFYGPKGGYSVFAGKDASRALAKMSFDPADLENTSLDDLEDKQKKILDDWIKTFGEKKKYPVVGKLEK